MPRRSLAARVRRRLGGGSGPGPLRVVLPSCQAQAMAEGPVALRGDAAALVDAPTLRVAVVVPSFRRGSGGHATIANLAARARGRRPPHERLGPRRRGPPRSREPGRDRGALPGVLRAPREPGPGRLRGLGAAPTSRWPPAGRPWRRSCACRARAPAPTWCRTTSPSSTPRRPSANGPRGPTGRGSTASPPRRGWPISCARATAPRATSFDLGIDHERYRPAGVERRDDRVLFYARAVTPRRAVPLGLLALAELHRRRPALEIALFGEARPIAAPFPHRTARRARGRRTSRAPTPRRPSASCCR